MKEMVKEMLEVELMDQELNEILESMGIYAQERNGYAHNHYGPVSDAPADYWDSFPWFD